MRAIGDFTPINQPEADVFGFDFASRLNAGETLTGTPTWTIGVETGIDADPDSHKVGPAQIQGTTVVQKISGMIAPVVYWMSATVGTSAGRNLTLWAPLDCEVIGC